MRLGIISDTHGLLRPEAARALSGVDLIVHAGDVGSSEVLTKLKALAPVFAVRGNVDTELWAKELPVTAIVDAGSASFYVLHNLRELDLRPEAAPDLRVPVRDIPRFIRLYQEGRLPVNRLIDGHIGFDELNAGFDKLQDVKAIRQILTPHGATN
jgi:hypothetical protein